MEGCMLQNIGRPNLTGWKQKGFAPPKHQNNLRVLKRGVPKALAFAFSSHLRSK